MVKVKPKRDQDIEELQKKNLSERREILKDIKGNVPDISQRGSPLDHVAQNDETDITRIKKRRL